MKNSYTIAVMAGPIELESERRTDIFGVVKARATERFEARVADGATFATVHDDVGRRVFCFPRPSLPSARMR